MKTETLKSTILNHYLSTGILFYGNKSYNTILK